MKMLRYGLLVIAMVVLINIIMNVSAQKAFDALFAHAEEALQAVENEEFDAAKVSCEQFITALTKSSTLLKLTLPHDKIEDIELDTILFRYAVEWEEKEEAILTLATLKQKLIFASEMQQLNWHNLF